MSYQQKSAIVSIIGTVVIFTIYCVLVFQKYQVLGLNMANDFAFWGAAFLILIPVLAGFQIVIMIVFTIINKVVTKEDPPIADDELDKLINLKSHRSVLILFMVGFFVSMALLVFGLPPRAMFISLAGSLILAGILGDITKLTLYQRGV